MCPIYVPNPSFYASDIARHGKLDQTIIDHYCDNNSSYIAVPCRHCLECVKARSAEWSARLRSELEWEMKLCGHDCYFVTLTIDPAHLGEFMTDGKVDRSKCSFLLGRFFRSLKDAYRSTFRHWVIGEYGECYGRLHFHCLFFNPPVSLETDGVHLHYSKNGMRMGSSPVLRRFWKYGFNDSGKVGSVAAGCYVSKYLVKSFSNDLTLPPIITSRNVGKNPDSIRKSLDVLRSCLATGIYSIPVVFGRYQHQHQISYSWMKKRFIGQLASEFGYSLEQCDLIIRYGMSLYYNRDRDLLSPKERLTKLENVLGVDLSYKNVHDVDYRRYCDLLNISVEAEDFYYGLDLEPF